jgi:hypothetical protein
MFIVLQDHGDPMVLDTVEGHRLTLQRLRTFLASDEDSVEIAAGGQCHLCPGSVTLQTFRVVKTDGLILVQQLPNAVLQVEGRKDLLSRYIKAFEFGTEVETDHHHPELRFFEGGLDRQCACIII